MDLKSLRDILGGGVQGVGTKLALKRQAWAGASVGAAAGAQRLQHPAGRTWRPTEEAGVEA